MVATAKGWNPGGNRNSGLGFVCHVPKVVKEFFEFVRLFSFQCEEARALHGDRSEAVGRPPPSKPDRQISRILLSSRWFHGEELTDLNQNDAERSHRPSQGHKVPCTPREVVNMSNKADRRFNASLAGRNGHLWNRL